jgi:hypothetical protein
MTYSDNEGKWFESDPFSYSKLHDAGYAIGGYMDDYGKDRFVLYRIDKGSLDKVHDFESLEALQLMAKLLIDGGM